MTKWCVLIAAAGCGCAAAHAAPFDQAYWIAVASAIVKVEASERGTQLQPSEIEQIRRAAEGIFRGKVG